MLCSDGWVSCNAWHCVKRQNYLTRLRYFRQMSTPKERAWIYKTLPRRFCNYHLLGTAGHLFAHQERYTIRLACVCLCLFVGITQKVATDEFRLKFSADRRRHRNQEDVFDLRNDRYGRSRNPGYMTSLILIPWRMYERHLAPFLYRHNMQRWTCHFWSNCAIKCCLFCFIPKSPVTCARWSKFEI